MGLIVTLERSETQNPKQFRCSYTITFPDGNQVKRGHDKNLWKKFMAGQLKVTVNAWHDENGKLIIGKVIK